MAVRAEQVNVQHISFGQLEDSSYVKSQKQAFINHKNQKLLTQTPYFLTETYGVPRAGDYYQTLKSRAFFKMPLCDDRQEFPAEVEYDAIRSFRQKLLDIDEMMVSNETKKSRSAIKPINTNMFLSFGSHRGWTMMAKLRKIVPSSFLQAQARSCI